MRNQSQPQADFHNFQAGTRFRFSWNSAYGGCTAARSARRGKNERKRHQEWKKRVGHNSRRMAEIIIPSFKRLLGEALAGGETRIHHGAATKIAVHNKTRTVMGKAVW